MKIIIILMMVLLTVNVAVACDNSVVSGSVENFCPGMKIKFYCSNEYSAYKNIISKYGTYYKTLDYCDGTLKGELYLDDVLMDTKYADHDGDCDFELDFTGLTQVPEFGTIGAGLALIGSAIYKFKKKIKK